MLWSRKDGAKTSFIRNRPRNFHVVRPQRAKLLEVHQQYFVAADYGIEAHAAILLHYHSANRLIENEGFEAASVLAASPFCRCLIMELKYARASAGDLAKGRVTRGDG